MDKAYKQICQLVTQACQQYIDQATKVRFYGMSEEPPLLMDFDDDAAFLRYLQKHEVALLDSKTKASELDPAVLVQIGNYDLTSFDALVSQQTMTVFQQLPDEQLMAFLTVVQQQYRQHDYFDAFYDFRDYPVDRLAADFKRFCQDPTVADTDCLYVKEIIDDWSSLNYLCDIKQLQDYACQTKIVLTWNNRYYDRAEKLLAN